jgi:threonine/homoserine/homoserine lactone efflux protein
MFWSFALTSLLIELTPGPNMTWLAVLGAAQGRKTALAAVAGILLGLTIAAIVAGAGLTAVFSQWPILLDVLRWLGTFYLLYLAWDAWRDAEEVENFNSASAAQAFRQGLITNILNPKAYLFYAAILPQFMTGTWPVATEVALLSGVYVSIATLIHMAIALMAGSLENFLKASPKAVTIRKILAALIAIAALWFFYSTRVLQ